MIRWVHPEFVGLALLVLLAGAAMGWGLPRRRQARLRRFQQGRGGPDLVVPPEPGRERWKWGLTVGALVLACLAAARPVGGLKPGAESERKSLRMAVVMDVSRSMLARDGGEHSRLERSGEAMRALLREASGDEVGLVVFRGGAATVTPPTRDLTALERLADLLSPEMMGLEGSRFEEAMDLALDGLEPKPGEPTVLWLFSDGEWHEGESELHARRLALAGVRLVVVGVGDPLGSPIPVKNPRGVEADLRHQGQRVISRLDEARLQRLARVAGGRYVRLEEGNTLVDIYREQFAPLRTVTVSDNPDDYRPWQWIPLGLALLLAAAEWMLPWRLRLPKGIAPLLPVVLLACVALAPPVRGGEAVEGVVERMQAHWDRGEVEEARRLAGQALERHPGEVTVLYNYGLAAYRVEDYETAAMAWEQVRAEFPAFHPERVNFQIGNARLRRSLQRDADALEAKEFDLRSAMESHARAAEAGREGAERNGQLSRKALADVLLRRGERTLESAGTGPVRKEQRWTELTRRLEPLRESVQMLDEAQKLDPERSDIREARERARERLAQHAEALARLRKDEGAGQLERMGDRGSFVQMGQAREGLEKLGEAAGLAEEAAEMAPSSGREALARELREQERQARAEVGNDWMDRAAEDLEAGRTPAQSIRRFEEGLEQVEAAAREDQAEDQQALRERREQLAEFREQRGDQLRKDAAALEPEGKTGRLQEALEQFERAAELAKQAAGGETPDTQALEAKQQETREELNEALVDHAQELLQEAAAAQEAGALQEALAKVDQAVGELAQASEQTESVAQAMEQAFAQRETIQAALPPEGDEFGSDPGEGEGVGREGKPPDEPDPDMPPPLLFQGQESKADTRRTESTRPW